VDDDLYVSANVFTLDGTVQGDLVVFAQAVIVNGTVEGDLIAAGQTIIINGKVTDDARIAGYGLQVNREASIGDDLVAAGFSLETLAGSTVGGDLVYAGAQGLLAGSVEEDALVGANGLHLRGEVRGNLEAAVGEATQEEGMPPSMFMPQEGIQVPIPAVAPGLTLDPDSKIGGDLNYTQRVELNLPASVVVGKITRTLPEIEGTIEEHIPTPAEQVNKWGFDLLRSMVTLILIGLFLGWLFPNFMGATAGKLQAQFWPSLGWGAVTYAVFFFALFLVIVTMILGGIFFGALTLGGLSGTIIWLGILILFAGILGFILATAYVTKILVGTIIGKWLLKFIHPTTAEHKIWPMIVGVIVLVFVIGMLRFPLAPLGFFGWLLNFAVILLGLGALWLWGRERFGKKPVVSEQ
jgi:cytoskeletal protein CcmA (bactofilin family)